MGVIGNIAISMTADTRNLTKGCETARESVSGLKGMLGAAKEVILEYGAAISAAAIVAGLTALAKSSFETITAVSRLSQTLGSSTESIAGLQYAAKRSGVETQMLGEQLGKLGNQLANAATAGGPAAEALKALGLDAKTLAGQDAVSAFKAIAEEISKIKNPAERAAKSVAIFGEEGLKMGTLINQGAKGIEAAQKEAQALGLAVSAVDAKKVTDAGLAMGRIGSAAEGIGNTIAIGVAPVIEEFAGHIVKLAPIAIAAVKGIVGIFNLLASAIGKVVGWIERLLGKLDFSGFLSGITGGLVGGFEDTTKAVGGTATAIDNAREGMNGFRGDTLKLAADVANLTKKYQVQIDTFGQTARQVEISKLASDGASAAQLAEAKAKDAILTKLEAEKKAKETAAEKTKALAESIKALNEKYDTQITTVGKTATEVEIYGLAQHGASAKDLEALKAKGLLVDKIEKQKKVEEDLKSKAKSVIEDIKTPEEKVAENLKELKTLFDKGLINEKQFDIASAKAKGELETSSKRGSAALDAGSVEARSLVLQAAGSSSGDPIKDVAKNGRDQLTKTDLTNNLLNQLVRASGAGVSQFAIN